jgi:NAD(P)-dependent dehydrogenase (short-subunit alcohol dehydrogenase family)
MTAFIELKHANVLVTGGSDGIGRDIAASYCGAGSSVLVTGRKHDSHHGNTKSRAIRTSCTARPPDNVT